MNPDVPESTPDTAVPDTGSDADATAGAAQAAVPPSTAPGTELRADASFHNGNSGQHADRKAPVLRADASQDTLVRMVSEPQQVSGMISPWELIFHSWRLFLANLDVFLALMWRPFAVTALAAFGAVELVQYLGVSLVTLLYTLVAMVVVIPVITAWHRMILLGSDNPEARVTYRVGAAEWAYFRGAALLYGLGYVVGLLVEELYGPLIGGPLLWVAREGFDSTGLIAAHGPSIVHWTAVAIIVGFLVARFFLVLPAAAVGLPFSFSQSASVTRGQGLRLILAYLLASVPAFGLAFMFDSPEMVLSRGGNTDAQFLDMVLAILPRILLYTIAVGILSLAFERLVGVPGRLRRKMLADIQAINAPMK